MIKNLKEYLPKELVKKIKEFKKTKSFLDIKHVIDKTFFGLNKYLVFIFSRNKFTSAIYYMLFSRSFLREQKSVLNGKNNYYANIDKPENSKFLLRRNVHRLEKGILMKPRRDIFALGYIRETVDAYSNILGHFNSKNGISIDAGELKWAYDVLTEYFSITGNHPHLNELRSQFNNLEQPFFESDESKYIPYKRIIDPTAAPPINYESLLEMSKFRRSVRWFKQQKVPRNLIDKAIEIASYSPTACNRQPYEYKIVDDPEYVKKLAYLPSGTPGYRDNIPVIIALVGKLDAYFHERDRHLIYIDASLSAMSFIYSLETLGLSSCCINWPDIEAREKKMDKLLCLKPYERVVMCIAVGYPDPEGKVAYSKKKNLDNIRSYFTSDES